LSGRPELLHWTASVDEGGSGGPPATPGSRAHARERTLDGTPAAEAAWANRVSPQGGPRKSSDHLPETPEPRKKPSPPLYPRKLTALEGLIGNNHSPPPVLSRPMTKSAGTATPVPCAGLGLVRGLLLGLVVLLISQRPAQAVIEEASVRRWLLLGAWRHDLEVLPGVRRCGQWRTAGGFQRQPHLSARVTPVEPAHPSRVVQVALRDRPDQANSHPAAGVLWATSNPLDGSAASSVDRGALPPAISPGQRQQEARPSPACSSGQGTDRSSAIRRQISDRSSKFWPAETYHPELRRQKQAQIQLITAWFMRTRSAAQSDLGLKSSTTFLCLAIAEVLEGTTRVEPGRIA